ncbi:MAG: hypothetical protein IPP08_02355 [Chlorobiota bacterium]|jgi:arginine exporter protein ArgO|nr:hypothetical protein [Chlorobiota bacterium]QQS67036.1 MAG: hypothetical protein IPP08_02355 [Chlorobiota bacterium]
MGIVLMIFLSCGVLFLIYYGFGIVNRKPPTTEELALGQEVECHLCKKKLSESKMIHRDKIAGFVNYFCGDCIEGLHDEYLEKFRGSGN